MTHKEDWYVTLKENLYIDNEYVRLQENAYVTLGEYVWHTRTMHMSH